MTHVKKLNIRIKSRAFNFLKVDILFFQCKVALFKLLNMCHMGTS